MDNYQSEVLKTLASNETFERYIEAPQLLGDLVAFMDAAHTLELAKKQIAYGKNLPDQPATMPIEPANVNILHAMLGIAGEAGEVVGAEGREDVKKEVGDLLWYIAVLLNEYDLDFPEVMQGNIDKLRERYSGGSFTREEALNPRN